MLWDVLGFDPASASLSMLRRKVRERSVCALSVRDRCARLEQERRVTVPQVVDADVAQSRFLQHAFEHVAHVALAVYAVFRMSESIRQPFATRFSA